MKKYILLAASLLGIGSLYAQDIQDALRYSQNGIHGDARYTAMSGAFGALGGTLSAINDNPASSAVFLDSQVDFSLLIAGKKSKSDFNNSHTDKNYTDLQLANAGIVMVYDHWDESSIWNKVTIGMNYKLDNAYGQNGIINGINNYSLSDHFVELANGIPLDLLNLRGNESISDLYSYLGENHGSNAQTAFLGYQAYAIHPIDPEDPDNTSYISNVSGNDFNQRKVLEERGYQGTFAFNLGTQLLDNLYLGLNLNANVIDYERRDVFEETPQENNSAVRYIGFAENLRTYGSGFSGQLGAIYRMDNGVRLGFTYTTPKWTRIEEQTMQSIESDHYMDGVLQNTRVNPNTLNVYEKYTLRTPAKIGASFAYVFGNHGLISLQYDYTNHANTRFKPRSLSYFGVQNDLMEEVLQESSSLRLGGEYNIGLLSVRGGLHYQESPYKDSKILGDTKGYSLGIGIQLDYVSLHLAYLESSQNGRYAMLPTDASTYRLDRTERNFILSAMIDF